MNFITVYLLFVLPLPLTLATGAVSFVSQFDVAYYEKHCQDDFSTGCPVYGRVSWICSKSITNCTSPDYPYHCIFNTAGKVVHVCAVAQICPKGTVPIFDPRTHMVSCQNCQKGYFRPLQLWSNNTPVCTKRSACETSQHKIECTVEPEKEPTQDTLCRCDADNDYILSHSEGREICVSSKYANCYKLKCPEDGQETLRNYTCVPRCEDGFQRDDNDICVPKSTVNTTLRDKAMPTSTASTENVSKGSISENGVYIVIIVISVFVAIIIIPGVFIFLYWKGKICSSISRQFRQVCWKTRHRNRQFSLAQIDDPEAGTVNNAPNDVQKPGTSNAPNDVQKPGTSNAPNDVQKPGTSNAPNDVQKPGTSNGTNRNARPRDIPNQERPRLEKLHRTVLNRCLPSLIKDLNFLNVMIYIQEKEIFDDVTRREIREQATMTKQILSLIDALQQNSKQKYEEFKECLVSSGQEDLKKILEEFEEKITKEIGEKRQAQDTND